MLEYRTVPAADLPELRRMRYYAFAPEDGPTAYESDEVEIMGAHRGLYDEEELVVCCSYLDFPTRIRGTLLHVGGIAGVVSPPERRRQGLVRRVCADVLQELREEEFPVSTLWPFDYEFYVRLGWAMACTYTKYELEPETLGAAAAEPAGRFRRLEADDWELLDPVFETFVSGYELATERSAEWWQRRVFKRWDEDRYVYAWETDGEVRAYVAYQFEGEGMDDRTLRVDEFGAADPEARRHLFRFLSNHDSQVGTVTFTTPTESTLLDEVADPRAVECTIEPGPMARLVSVEDAIEALAYPDELAGSVTVTVADSLADWNDDTFEIAFADGRASCERTSAANPDVRLDIGALSQLYVGYQSLDDLRQLGSVAIEDSHNADVLSDAFPKRSTHLPEGF